MASERKVGFYAMPVYGCEYAIICDIDCDDKSDYYIQMESSSSNVQLRLNERANTKFID